MRNDIKIRRCWNVGFVRSSRQTSSGFEKMSLHMGIAPSSCSFLELARLGQTWHYCWTIEKSPLGVC